MKSSVYISAEHIQVIGYAGKNVKQVATYPIPEGTMFNGTIMDGTFLSECLTNMKQEHPKLFKAGVSLVVDGSSILTRKLATPRLSHKQYLQRVRDDFVDSISDTNELVCGYRKLSDGTILGCGVGKAQVDSYIETFKAAGIKLTSIRVGAELLHSLVSSTKALQEQTIVLNVLDGTTMLSAVFVQGNNIMLQRTRLYGDEKEQILKQIIENLSNLNQFAQSQKHPEISQSFYIGLTTADVNMLEGMNTHEGIRVVPMAFQSETPIPPAAHFAYLNIRFGQGAVDLVEARRELDRFIKSKKPKRYWIPAFAVYAVILIGIAGWLWWDLRGIQERVDNINSFLFSPSSVDARAELNGLIQETSHIERIAVQFNNRLSWESTMPTAASHMVERILFGHGMDVYISTFDFNEVTGVVRVSAATRDARLAFDYIQILYFMELAEQVIFTGYNIGADDMYNFSIDIYLAIGEDEYADQ
ncbi:MAG: hypothetical protein FWC16_05250 [Defluviitaleaceae bacterium]|nr:hypothetical protein [Defluviitaleaceae bacterium]MCL2274314.1 hypothetical protein [Defluviitaleaceae bacterium]